MKTQEELVGLSSTSIVNQLRALKERKPKYDMHGLMNENWLKWFLQNLANLGNSHYTYQTYLKPAVNNGVFRIDESTGIATSIALLSDWASDTIESVNVSALVGKVDYSIHLGDTYYVGNYKEIANNFNTTIGGSWPYGTKGSFALLGNHEMYSSGRSYFKQLLPYMGTYTEPAKQQEASFFCLENEHWRIIGLDTGYDSLRGWLGVKPNYDLRLPPMHLDWLKNILADKADKRSLIFLSHHQYVSAFEHEYTAFAKDLSGLLPEGKRVLWFWGHEHRLAVYGKNPLVLGQQVFGRCIGTGGMPVEIGKGKPRSVETTATDNRNLVVYDNRVRNRYDNRIDLGHNGYAMLNLLGPELRIGYYDDNVKVGMPARLLMQEVWIADNVNGSMQAKSFDIMDKALTIFQENIRQAID